MFRPLRNHLRHPHPLRGRPELRYSSQSQPQSYRFSFLDIELPVTLYRHQERNYIPIIHPQYSLPQPFLFTHPSPPALVRHTHASPINAPLPGPTPFSLNRLQISGQFFSHIVTPSTILTMVLFFTSSRKLAKTANFPIRS